MMIAAASGGFHVDTGVILAVVAVIAFLVTAAGVVGTAFRVGHNTQTVANYRETAQSWKEKSDAQEAQIVQLQEGAAAKNHQIAELTAKVDMLEKLVLGESTAKGLRADLGQIKQGVSQLLERIPA
jgi:uncharacterized protein HemX